MIQRLLDDQSRLREIQYGRADALTRLAIAEAGGIVAILGFLVAHGYTAGVVWTLVVGGSILLNFAALTILSVVGGGASRRQVFAIGPDPEQIEDAVVTHRASRLELLRSSLSTLRHQYVKNTHLLELYQRFLVSGLAGLVGSGILLLAAVFYISGVHILV